MSSKKDLPSWLFFLLGGLFALLLFAFGAGSAWLYLSQASALNPAGISPSPPLLTDVFSEAWQVIEQDYYGEMPAPTERTYGAIRGSLATLDDPHTYFIEPEPAGREQEQLQGHFGGIGAYLEASPQGRIILRPMVGRPAAEAGIEDGDMLIAIDGAQLAIPADLEQVTDRVRGAVDSVVRLQVLRAGKVLTFEITRRQIELPSVSWRYLEAEPGLLLIRIERFSELTQDEFAEALRQASAQQPPTAVILDLRRNPGGLLTAALAISDDMIDNGLLLIERHADGTEQRYQASADSLLDPSLTVLVLMDGGTASAAEIVAGALQDHRRATLIGQTSYGKGSIQRVHRLSDQSAIHVTFARWFTPNDHQIDGIGLQPDITIESDQASDKDVFLSAAIDYLHQSPTP